MEIPHNVYFIAQSAQESGLRFTSRLPAKDKNGVVFKIKIHVRHVILA